MKKILWTIFIVITVLTMVITPITIHVFSPSMVVRERLPGETGGKSWLRLHRCFCFAWDER